jgi:hypothetical protein
MAEKPGDSQAPPMRMQSLRGHPAENENYEPTKYCDGIVLKMYL